MYTNENFKSKKALKEAVAAGKAVTLFAPGYGAPMDNGIEYVSGPWAPKAHSWYAQVVVKDGLVIKVK